VLPFPPLFANLLGPDATLKGHLTVAVSAGQGSAPPRASSKWLIQLQASVGLPVRGRAKRRCRSGVANDLSGLGPAVLAAPSRSLDCEEEHEDNAMRVSWCCCLPTWRKSK
jgi:hypothetical protein